MSASPDGLQSTCILYICGNMPPITILFLTEKKSVCIVFKPDRYMLKSDIVLDGVKLEYVKNAEISRCYIKRKVSRR